MEKIEVKKTVNKFARGLLFYEIMMFSIVCMDMIIRMISQRHTINTDAQLDALSDQLMQSGTSSIIAVLVGIIFLYWYFRKMSYSEPLFSHKKTMTVKSFFIILTVFMAAQVVFSICGMGLELGLNQIGYSILEELKSASSGSTTISMFLYASFLGPISEEIIFRGFILRGFEKYGKRYAIIISALLFGAFHGNLIQSIFAMLVGLVLGYIATEYSIKWSIIIHIINNFVFGDLLNYLTRGYGENVQSIILYSIENAFFIGAIIILILKRKQLQQYLKREKVEKGLYRFTFTAFWMNLFLIIQLILGISGIEKIV